MTDEETPNSRRRSERLTAAAKAQEARDQTLADLKQEVAELREQGSKPTGGSPAPQQSSIPPIRWHELNEEERDGKLEELRTWMRDVLFPRFPAEADQVRWCWALHPTAVETLTTLWQTWEMCWSPQAGPAPRAQWIWLWRKQAKDDLKTVLSSCEDKHRPSYQPAPCVIDGIHPDEQETAA